MTLPPSAPPGPVLPPPRRGSLLTRLGLLGRLMRKELREILRDRRTILTLVLMPLLLYPLLGIAFHTFLLDSMSHGPAPSYRVGTLRGPQQKPIEDHLINGLEALHAQLAYQGRDASRSEKAAPSERQGLSRILIKDVDDLEFAVLHGDVDVAIRSSPRRGPLLALDWGLLYREDSAYSLEAVRFLEQVCTAANVQYLKSQLHLRADPVRTLPVALHPPRQRTPTVLSGLVPLILILMTITGAVYPAIDVTAGERERGTLEILAAAPVSRLGVLFAKYVAVLTVAMLTALVNLGTMAATLLLTGIGRMLFGEAGLSLLVFVEVLALLLLFAAFFSAMLLALTSFARSFKEAQAYLIPLMLVSLMPGVLSLIPGLQLDGPLAVIPLLNISLLTRDLLEGMAEPGLALVVVLSTFLYAVAALALAARIFGAEAVLYSQQGSWADLFRRRRAPRRLSSPDNP
jgi:sodium transport system permease protein